MTRVPRIHGAVLLAAALLAAGCGTATPGDGDGAGRGDVSLGPPVSGAPGSPASGSPAPGSPTPGPTATQVSAGRHVCLAGGGTDPYGTTLPDDGHRPRLPAGTFRFVRCRGDIQTVPGQGVWLVRVEEETQAGQDELAAALRRPDGARTDQACAAYLDISPDLWAVDGAGRALLVRIPRDACAHIQPPVKQAMSAARWQEIGRRRLQQQTPQAALDAGCESAYSDMAGAAGIAGDGAGTDAGALASGARGLAAAPAGRLCIYRVTDGGPKPNGPFVSGQPLATPRWRSVVAALGRTPPAARGCSTLPRRFAVVLPAEGEPAYVELDTCRRVLLGGAALRQATPELVRLLTAG